tara:strand:+ start:351 stop:584 length:234 start_codon:yes stop_codon:yes gene_type:complete
MDYEAIIAVLFILLFFGSDVVMMVVTLRDVKKRKAKTGRFFVPWSSLGMVQKGLRLAMVGLMVLLVYWLSSDLGLAP